MVAPTGGLLSLFLLIGGAILAGFIGHLLFKRYRVSEVLLLLGLGLLVGPLLRLVDPTLLTGAFTFLGPLGLLIVLFEGGLELAWEDLRKHAGRALGMSLLTWLLTAGAIALVAHLLLGLSPVIALLLGVATCATGILVVIPLLTQLKAPADARVMLTVETSLGDLLSAVATTAIAGMLVLGATPMAGLGAFGSKFLVGAAMGVLAGLGWARVLCEMKGQRHGYALTLAALMLAYVAAEELGGSGFLMALAFGLVVGNAGVLSRAGGIPRLATLAPDMRLYQSEIIFIVKSLYFVYLGLVVSRDVFLPGHLLAGAAMVAAMVLARVVGVNLALAGSGMPLRDPTRLLLVGMLPRGLATALIAGIPVAMGVPGTEGFLTYTFLLIVGADLATTLGVLAYERARARVAPLPLAPTPHAALGDAAPVKNA